MRRRRSRRCQPFGRLESLETRRLLAVDVVQPFVDITVDAGTQALVIDLAAAFDLASLREDISHLEGEGPEETEERRLAKIEADQIAKAERDRVAKIEAEKNMLVFDKEYPQAPKR